MRVLVPGGAGYVGSVLVPKLLEAGHEVTVLDWFLFGETLQDHPQLRKIKGDIRNRVTVNYCMTGQDAVIHLACISNDPSYEMDPALGQEVNHTSFKPLVLEAMAAGVQRFIYASSSSVYGVQEGDVTEDRPLKPLTDYSKFKAICEQELAACSANRDDFCTTIIRPATVCGYSPRQRLDVIVNILTAQAYHTGTVQIHGGGQLRPNIHIEDMAELYVKLLRCDPGLIGGKTYNAGYSNSTVLALAYTVKRAIDKAKGVSVNVQLAPSNDPRSYHISSDLIARELGWRPKRSIGDAVRGLVKAFDAGMLPDAMTDPRYSNIKTMMREVEVTTTT